MKLQITNYKLENLRKKYPKFVYEKYSCEIKRENLEISFLFKIEPDIIFQPKIIIENIPGSLQRSDLCKLENLIFHLGLMEIPSYWKATCSPVIEIKAGHLNKEQIKWWHNLIIRSMGQFYYENKIDWRKKDFLKIYADKRPGLAWARPGLKNLVNRFLVPFAGGRDSIVTLEALKKRGKDIALFTVNPIKKIQKVVKVSGIKEQIIVKRLIDKKLLALNKNGCLNGHTPFTGVLSFISLLCAVIFDYRNIAFSNEKSAEEGNVKYLGKIINHQWAKSLEFEKMFQFYAKKYLVKNVNYFSFLRKYGELEISKIFSKYKKYFPFFSSCNAGMKISSGGQLAAKERWCGNCPKCLFVYMALYPYLNEKELLEIFGKDIFDPSTSSGREKLLLIMKGLLGRGRSKPFECVGTKAESRLAFKLCLQRVKRLGKLPYLLRKAGDEVAVSSSSRKAGLDNKLKT